MTPSQLKYHVQSGSDSHFFERSSMQFFGDTMKNYGVRSTSITVHLYNAAGNYCGTGVREVWELYRKHPVKHGMKDSAYFDKETFAKRSEVKE